MIMVTDLCIETTVSLLVGDDMNERFEQLAKQARKSIRYRVEQHTLSPIEDPNGPYERFEFDIQKFAELIVRDCIEIVEPCKCGCCDGEPEGIITATIIKQIKQHFGVE